MLCVVRVFGSSQGLSNAAGILDMVKGTSKWRLTGSSRDSIGRSHNRRRLHKYLLSMKPLLIFSGHRHPLPDIEHPSKNGIPFNDDIEGEKDTAQRFRLTNRVTQWQSKQFLETSHPHRRDGAAII